MFFFCETSCVLWHDSHEFIPCKLIILLFYIDRLTFCGIIDLLLVFFLSAVVSSSLFWLCENSNATSMPFWTKLLFSLKHNFFFAYNKQMHAILHSLYTLAVTLLLPCLWMGTRSGAQNRHWTPNKSTDYSIYFDTHCTRYNNQQAHVQLNLTEKMSKNERLIVKPRDNCRTLTQQTKRLNESNAF